MNTKTICFTCREHSTKNKLGTCYRCQSEDIIRTGPALRLPKKNALSQWKVLYQLYFLQKKKAAIKGNDFDYMRGFSNNFNSHISYGKQNMPIKEKEKATMDSLLNYSGW